MNVMLGLGYAGMEHVQMELGTIAANATLVSHSLQMAIVLVMLCLFSFYVLVICSLYFLTDSERLSVTVNAHVRSLIKISYINL